MISMRTIVFALLLAPLQLAAQAPAETLFNLVSLNAQAEREIPNDLLTATLAAEAEGADPAPLADGVNRTMQRALATALAYKSVKAQSAGYQTVPVYDKNRVVRWRVRQELRLESTDFAAATELIGKLQAALVVTGLTQSVSGETRHKAENALIAEAVAAFDERARVVRDAMKAKGYRVRDLQVSPGGAPPRPVFAMSARTLASESVAQPALEPGSSRILITVSGTIQLQ
jgi:predicted secreted protein